MFRGETMNWFKNECKEMFSQKVSYGSLIFIFALVEFLNLIF